MCKELDKFIDRAEVLFQEKGLTIPEGLSEANGITDLLEFLYDYMTLKGRMENNLLSELMIEHFSEKQLRDGGFLVNPDLIPNGLDVSDPVVLLSEDHLSVRQETNAHVTYIGGKNTSVNLVGGDATLYGQRSLSVGNGCEANATDVATITVGENGILTALRCPKITALEGADIFATDSLVEVEDFARVKAFSGTRIIALGESADLTLTPGALAVVRNSFPIKGREDAAVIRTVDMDPEMEAELLRRLRSMDSVARDPKSVDTFPELIQLCHDAILREKGLQHADMIAGGIQACKDYETLAKVITSHFGRFGETFPYRAVVDSLPVETLYANNIFTNRSVPDHIATGKVAHVFGNITLPEKWTFPGRVHLHDHAVARGHGDVSIKAWDKSAVQVLGTSDLVAVGDAFVIADASARLETWNNARFYARGMSEVMSNGHSSGQLLENARVDAGEWSRVHVKSAGRSTFFDDSKALVEDPSAFYVAWQKAEVSVLGEPRGQSFDNSVVRTTLDKETFRQWEAEFYGISHSVSKSKSR